ncbi:MAG TPA: hypothetical protein VFW44_13690 [Bryobacteraceae bacterium]|nr:hypothetical protein [Bryobacteraceae bacterium]
MISDTEIVNACAASYHQPATLARGPLDPYIVISTASDGETLLVINRGSVTAPDWLRDFQFAPIEIADLPQLGRCHAGFMASALKFLPAIMEAVGDRPAIYGGHSLGGAEAVAEAALMATQGKPPAAIVTFGAPRVGMAAFVHFMSQYAVRQWVRGNDPVPDVPIYFAPDFEFLDTAARILIGRPQVVRTSCHHIEGYQGDVAACLHKAAA